MQVTNSGTVFPDAETLFLIAKKFGLNMNIFFECDHYKFLGYLESCEIFDEELMGLISNYKNLSSFAKGMLIERSVSLMEWDRMIMANKAALDSRLKKRINQISTITGTAGVLFSCKQRPAVSFFAAAGSFCFFEKRAELCI